MTKSLTKSQIDALGRLKGGPQFVVHNSTATALRRRGLAMWARVHGGWVITESGLRAYAEATATTT